MTPRRNHRSPSGSATARGHDGAERRLCAAVVLTVITFTCTCFGQEDSKPASGTSSAPPTPAFDLQATLERMDDLYRSGSSIAEIEMTVVKPRRSRTLTMKAWSKGTEKSLVLVTAPPRDEGHATLKVGNNLWTYQPRIRRTIRVPPSMMLSSWMGSDFTHDDMVHEFRLAEDYEAALLGRAADGEGWKIELKAKPHVVGLWERIVYTVSNDGDIPLEALYYNRRNELSRRMSFDEVVTMDGRRLPRHMVLQPLERDGSAKPDQRTELRYLSLNLNADVPESKFSLSGLERLR